MITLEKLKTNWQWYLMMVVANVVVFYVAACPPTTESLNGTTKQVTREELQLELVTIIKTAELRMAELDKQDELRQLIINNAVTIATGTPVNPLGILTGVLALYGAGSAITSGKKKVCTCLTKKKYDLTTKDSGA